MNDNIHVFDDGIKLTEEQHLGNLLMEWQEKCFRLYNEKENLLCEIERLKAELEAEHRARVNAMGTMKWGGTEREEI